MFKKVFNKFKIKYSIKSIINQFKLHPLAVKKVEDNLRECEERWHLVLCGNNDGIWDWNINTDEVFFSSRWKHMLGFKDDELENRISAWTEKIHPCDSSKVKVAIDEYLNKSTDSLSIEQRVLCKNGNYKWILSRGQALWDSQGKPTRIVGSFSDITELKLAEEAQKQIAEENQKLLNKLIELDKFKTEFFANLSHELKTPITVMLSTIQLSDYYLNCEDKEFNKDKFKKHSTILKQNCFRLQKLVNNLIDITKIDSGYIDMHFKNQNIVSLVKEIVLSVKGYMENSGLSFQFETDVEEKIMSVDSEKIERIMLNLISNAVKFTDAGGKISINIYDRKGYVIISVKDTGIGIEPDKLGIIFERFRQVDKSLLRNHEGSGIGLSLVKSLVEMHNGIIHAKSEYGKGSEFIVELPSKVSSEENLSDEGMQYNLGNQIPMQRIDVEFSDICTKTKNDS